MKNYISLYIYVYIYIFVCVCVYVLWTIQQKDTLYSLIRLLCITIFESYLKPVSYLLNSYHRADSMKFPVCLSLSFSIVFCSW